jgi:hypothetical protein
MSASAFLSGLTSGTIAPMAGQGKPPQRSAKFAILSVVRYNEYVAYDQEQIEEYWSVPPLQRQIPAAGSVLIRKVCSDADRLPRFDLAVLDVELVADDVNSITPG